MAFFFLSFFFFFVGVIFTGQCTSCLRMRTSLHESSTSKSCFHANEPVEDFYLPLLLFHGEDRSFISRNTVFLMQIVMQWVLEGTLSWNSEHVRLIAAQTTPPNYSVVAIAP